MPNGVLILAEVADGDIAPITQELVGAAQRLNAGPVSAMLIGSGVEGAASKITGVEKTYVVDDAALAQYTTDGYTHAAAGRRRSRPIRPSSCSARRTSAATSARRSRSSSAPPSRWTPSRWR